MHKLKKYVTIGKCLMRLELMSDLMYRLNALLLFLSTSSWLIAEILFIHFITEKFSTIAGWGKYELTFLLAVNQIWVGGFFYFIIWPSLTGFAEMIKVGGIDRILTLPINTRFYISVYKISWPSLSIMFNGIVLAIYSFGHLGFILSFVNVISFIILLIVCGWIIYCIQFIAVTLTFWIIESGAQSYIIGAIDRLARFPYEIFTNNLLLILFTFVLPITIVTNVPARALLGILEWRFVIYALIVAIWLTIVSQVIWKIGLRRYESASS